MPESDMFDPSNTGREDRKYSRHCTYDLRGLFAMPGLISPHRCAVRRTAGYTGSVPVT